MVGAANAAELENRGAATAAKEATTSLEGVQQAAATVASVELAASVEHAETEEAMEEAEAGAAAVSA